MFLQDNIKCFSQQQQKNIIQSNIGGIPGVKGFRRTCFSYTWFLVDEMKLECTPLSLALCLTLSVLFKLLTMSASATVSYTDDRHSLQFEDHTDIHARL